MYFEQVSVAAELSNASAHISCQTSTTLYTRDTNNFVYSRYNCPRLNRHALILSMKGINTGQPCKASAIRRVTVQGHDVKVKIRSDYSMYMTAVEA